jgi:3-hydroxyisobutyrate dehydrogenase
MTQRLGFIGLGNLGVHLASSLVRAGFAVTVYDLNKEAATGLLATGATWTDSPQAVAEECDSVFTCLPSSRAVSMLKNALGTALRAPGFPAMLEG